MDHVAGVAVSQRAPDSGDGDNDGASWCLKRTVGGSFFILSEQVIVRHNLRRVDKKDPGIVGEHLIC